MERKKIDKMRVNIFFFNDFVNYIKLFAWWNNISNIDF